MVYFCLLHTGVKGTLGNIYSPSFFLEKHAFIDFLGCIKEKVEIGNWILGGDFKLIANLGEKKGGRRFLDKYQESFCDFLAQSPLVDMDMGSGWFT